MMVGNILAFFSGFVSGLIINYLADFLPISHRLIQPACRVCDAKFPLLNYFFWPKRCPKCSTPRSIRTWCVELGMGLFGIFWINYSSIAVGFLPGMLIMAFLVLITVIDIEHHLILHLTSFCGAILGLWVGVKLHGWQSTLIGGAAGFGIMFLFYFLGMQYIRISQRLRGKENTEEDAIGFGDVNLSGVVGLMLGWPGILMGLLIAILAAGGASLVYLLIMIARKKYHPDLAIPYGPFLTISAFLLIFVRPFFF